MSKVWLRSGGILLVLLTLASVSRSRPDPSPQPVVPPTRVAVFNLAFVIKHMKLAAKFQAQIKAEFKTYDDHVQELQKQQTSLSESLKASGIAADKRKEIDEEIKKLKRQIEDTTNDAKKALGKKSDEQLVILYTMVRKAAEAYAKGHGIDLVLHYEDAVEAAQLDSPEYVARKLQNVACFPIYSAPEVDISKEILAELNANDRSDLEE